MRFVIGKNSVKEILKKEPHRVKEIYTCSKGELPWLDEAKKHKIPLKRMDKKKLEDLVGSSSHQSIVALVEPKGFVDLKSFFKKCKDTSLVVLLDSIFDPHNFGAILRACECFGVDLVVYSKNRGVDLTPVVTKVSVGASELIPLCRVSNLAETVRCFQQEDYTVVTTGVGAGAKRLYEFSFPEKTLLILGSEGKGVQPLLVKLSEVELMIPMKGVIDSLNVSQAAAVFLSQYAAYHALYPSTHSKSEY